MNYTNYVCKSCGHVGSSKPIVKGSFIGELSFYIVVTIIAAMSSWALLIVPLAYTIYRQASKSSGCELCNSSEIIPADSPNGMTIINKSQDI